MIDTVPAGPDDWMVYGQPDEGGSCVTFFYGTEQECREFAEKHRDALSAAVRGVRAEDLAQEKYMAEGTT
jgi:hypothetical protein